VKFTMLDKFKAMGGQIQALAANAIDGVDQATASTVEEARKLAGMTGEATSAMTEAAIRKAVRRLQQLVSIAADELEKKPPPTKPMLLLGSFQGGLMSLQLQVEIDGSGSGGKPLMPADEQVPAAPGGRSGFGSGVIGAHEGCRRVGAA
jgi:hypothetical protein